jgi:hypothetical protein
MQSSPRDTDPIIKRLIDRRAKLPSETKTTTLVNNLNPYYNRIASDLGPDAVQLDLPNPR